MELENDTTETTETKEEPASSLEAMQQAVAEQYKEGDTNDGELPTPVKAADDPDLEKPQEKTEEADAAPQEGQPAVTKDKESVKELGIKPEKSTAEQAGSFDHLFKIPHGLKGKDRAQFTQLRDHARQIEKNLSDRDAVLRTRDSDIESYKADRETLSGFRAVIDDVRAQPEQMNVALQLIGHVNHGRYEQALDLLDKERKNLAILSGKSVPGVDLLSQHPDLVRDVEEGTITQERADELALARARGGLIDSGIRTRADAQQVEQEKRAQENQSQQQVQAERTKAVADMQAFVQSKKKSDINFSWKEPLLVEKLDRILDKIPPSLWAHQIEIAYDLLVAARSDSKATVTPLRPRGGASGQQSAQNSLQAMQLAVLGRTLE